MTLAFFGGTAVAWLAIGLVVEYVTDGVELHPDQNLLGASCLLCPLVGLLAAIVIWKLVRRPKS